MTWMVWIGELLLQVWNLAVKRGQKGFCSFPYGRLGRPKRPLCLGHPLKEKYQRSNHGEVDVE